MRTLTKSLPLLILVSLLAAGCASHVKPPLETPQQPARPKPNSQALDHYIHAVVLDQQGEITRAISEYRRALQFDSTAAAICIALAEDYFTLRLYDDAVLQLQEALRVEPDNVSAMEFLSDLMVETGQMDSAIALAGRLIELQPDELRYRRNLAGLYLRMDSLQAAIGQYQGILAKYPEDGEALSQISAIYITMKDFPKALDVTRQLYDLDSTDDRVTFTIASLYAELDKPTEADHYFSRAVELNPDDPRYFTNWAYLRLNAKDYAQAIAILQKGTLKHPRAADVWGLLGSAYQQAGSDSSAIKALDYSLELDATQVGPYVTLGYIYDSQGKFDKALEVYTQGLAVAPEDPLLLNNYAYMLAQKKVRLDEALNKVKIAVAKSPDNPSFLDTMGWVYFGLGDLVQARQCIEKALAKDENNPTILEHLGDVLSAMNDKDNARTQWLKALQHDPDNVQIREKLAQ
jgi:tetratricopeptide (TPR) repeat protein